MTRRIAGPEPIPRERFAATADLADAIGRWQSWLADERRCSPHTLNAYGRDLAGLLGFIAEHLGTATSLARWPGRAGRLPGFSGRAIASFRTTKAA
jgi:hypothetical protein